MSLMGKTLKYDYIYPDRNTPAAFDFGKGDITVKDGVEVTNSFYTMDVADTNGDGRADFTIHLDDAVKLKAGNFEL